MSDSIILGSQNQASSGDGITDLVKNGDTWPLTGLVFVLAGRFAKNSDIEKKITLHGGVIAKHVTSKVSYVISNDQKPTEKLNKAKELNIPIISEEDLSKLCNQSTSNSSISFSNILEKTSSSDYFSGVPILGKIIAVEIANI